MTSPVIAFLDDDEKTLEGLKRALSRLRPGWTNHFFAAPDAALSFLQSTPCDVVVVDMVMPEMSGTQVLNRLLEIQPEFARLVLSGRSSISRALAASKVAHQFLTKPCPPDRLCAVIERILWLRGRVGNQTVRRILSGETGIPSAPAALSEIIDELQQREPNLKRIGELIEHDPGLTAKLLQIVNSAFFGTRHSVARVSVAVDLMGLDLLRAILIANGIQDAVAPDALARAGLAGIWSHAQEMAILAQRLARALGGRAQASAAFIGGLLHDVGPLVLGAREPETYRRLIDNAADDPAAFLDSERAAFGLTHVEMGGYLLGLWGLDMPFVELVERHAEALPEASKDIALTAVHIANLALGDPGQSRENFGKRLKAASPVLAAHGLTPAAVELLMAAP